MNIMRLPLLLTFVLVLFAPNLVAKERNTAVYLTMPDGTRLAADIWMPDSYTEDQRIPAMLTLTRYWRASSFKPAVTKRPTNLEPLNKAGYAMVIVDVRGSGASFGTRGNEFSVCETRDFPHVVNWVAEQPWSNGRVATIGVSYTGNTAEHATFIAPPALRAAIPRFTDFDGYRHILYPGGIRNELIARNWGAAVAAMDANTLGVGQAVSQGGPVSLGVKPVDEDHDRSLLVQAIAQHANNLDVTATFSNLHHRDQMNFTSDLDESCEHFVSPYRFMRPATREAVPSWHWGSWMDAGTAAGIISRFAGSKAPNRYVIGPWSHGARHDVNPFKPKNEPVQPAVAEQYKQIFEFLEPYMLGNGAERPARELTYFTMGEGVWKKTRQWPPKGQVIRSLYLAPDSRLKQSIPRRPSRQEYAVDFEAGTGSSTRWTTQLGGGEVFYGDRAAADERLLVYDSTPLPQATEITGHPVVELYLSSDREDGVVIAYLESVAPDGKVTMITEGELRLIHRKVSDEEPPYPIFGPYHSFHEADAQPMTPGRPERVTFVMLPTSVLIPAGHRIRLALAGHDKDSFARYPAEGPVTFGIQQGSDNPSKLLLPVIRKQGDRS